MAWIVETQGGSTVDPGGVLAEALLGGGLPPEAEDRLVRASLSYHDDSLAEDYLREAEALAPGHAAVLIGLYRFYFYKGRLEEALEIAGACLKKAGRENNFSTDWRDVRPGDARFDSYEEILPRFFLFSLKGYAYLQMRLGRLEEGRGAVDKLLELDPSDKIGARVLLDIVERQGRDDDD
jgi:tetratricopeptide (TPR) repeat protein